MSTANHVKINSNHLKRWTIYRWRRVRKKGSLLERLGKNITPMQQRNHLFTKFAWIYLRILTNIYILLTMYVFFYFHWHI